MDTPFLIPMDLLFLLCTSNQQNKPYTLQGTIQWTTLPIGPLDSEKINR